MAQWCCKSNLANGTEKVRQDSSYEITDDSKQVIVNPEQGRISLNLDASNEYTVQRKLGEGWPHLLLEQDFTYKPNVFSAKKILLKIDLCLDRIIDRRMPNEEADFHTAQFVWVFALADKTRGKGFDDFIWFGCPIYDFRYDVPIAYFAQDGGKQENTGKFIYLIDGKNYLSSRIPNGKRVELEIDVTQHMKDAILLAKERHFLLNSDPQNIVINNTNFGWEVTGTFDVGMTIFDVSLRVED